MRRLLKWLLITLGIAAVVRKLRSRRGAAVASAPEATVATETSVTVTTTTTTEEDPADELRRKLADTREPEDASVDDRRADVHEQGRSTIDDMRSSAGDG